MELTKQYYAAYSISARDYKECNLVYQQIEVMNISVQMIPVYRVADYNAWIFLFLPVSFYLAYCQAYHNSRLSLFISIYCALQSGLLSSSILRLMLLIFLKILL